MSQGSGALWWGRGGGRKTLDRCAQPGTASRSHSVLLGHGSACRRGLQWPMLGKHHAHQTWPCGNDSLVSGHRVMFSVS